MKRQRISSEEFEDPSQEECRTPFSSSRLVSCLKDFDRAVRQAAVSLHAGNLIALPTDTIYGICGLAQSSVAVRKIYEVKERDPNKPVAICVARISDLHKWAHVDLSKELLSDLLPGPVTLVFQRRKALNPELNPGTDLIGIRIPDDSFIRRLTADCGEPLALTSANKSGQRSPLTVDEFVELWPCLDLIVDRGRLGSSDESCQEGCRLGSTVVDLSEHGHFRLIRNGSAMAATTDILRKHGLRESAG